MMRTPHKSKAGLPSAGCITLLSCEWDKNVAAVMAAFERLPYGGVAGSRPAGVR
jgi:hypothetical protein